MMTLDSGLLFGATLYIGVLPGGGTIMSLT